MKTKKFLSMAALALVGAMMTGCSSDDNFAVEQQPENQSKSVTLTTTIGLDDGGTTRALTATGVKTFAAGETMAIYYWKNKGNDHVKAVSAPLTAGDITNGGKSATFTFTLDNPYKDMSVSYVYPAAMANADFTPNYDALYNNQDGTLATLASNFDFCTRSGAWVGDNLPSLTLVNQLAILAITLKNSDGSSDITSSITGLTLSDGTNTYNITGKDADGHIYAAIRPTTGATINVTATDGSKNYGKKLATTKTYAAGKGYNVTWNMTDASVVNLAGRSEGEPINVSNGETITGTLTDGDYPTYATITIEDGAIVTLKNVEINPVGDLTTPGSDISGITCDGNATIILEGTNTVNGFDRFGIEVKSGKTLTILGTGTLNASGNSGAGIGGEGNIVINGGNITATGGSNGGAGIGGYGENGTCGNITISGGTVTATGGNKAAGIGSSYSGFCGNITISGGIVEATGGSDGNLHGAGIGSGASCSIENTISITITSGVTSVTATRGGDGGNCKFIGAGSECSSGAIVTIDGVANATTSSTFTNFNSSVSGNTWTLTHK